MRRAVTSFLILALLAGQLGMLGALLGQRQAHQQMKRQIEGGTRTVGSDLEVKHLALTQSDRESPRSSFVRIEEREFRYQGRLYDVVHATWQEDVWHVWVVHDREEERYLDALAQSMETLLLEGQATPVPKSPLVFRPMAVVPAPWAPLPSPHLQARSFWFFSSLLYRGPYLDVPHPPPWG